ncbi:MAG: hypothetical protein JSW58_11765 [Candidatus Latescibacterota bacterium]|nr:MAG: hypothetical protein JSW58_11765 [Candidatus Latescibacterota bacterium]
MRSVKQPLEQKYREELSVLGRLFGSRLSASTLTRLNEIFEHTEGLWQRYVDQIPDRMVQYLLVAEAPPWSETGRPQYILDPLSRPRTLMNALCRAFFGRPIYNELGVEATLSALAQHGFLVVDSIPFAMPYGGKRGNRAYKELVWMTCGTYLGEKLRGNNLTYSDTLNIAFAFKLNALEVMKGVNNEFVLAAKRRPLNSGMIAVNNAGYPDGGILSKILGLDKKFPV